MPNFRSQSLPFLDDDCEDEEGHFNRRSQLQHSSHVQREELNNPTSNLLPGLSNSLDMLCNSSLYQLAGTPGNQNMAGMRMSNVSMQESDATYAEVPLEPVPNHFLVDNTYEQIPDTQPSARAEEKSHTNTYETLTDLKPKQIISTRAIKVSVLGIKSVHVLIKTLILRDDYGRLSHNTCNNVPVASCRWINGNGCPRNTGRNNFFIHRQTSSYYTNREQLLTKTTSIHSSYF